MSVPDYTTKKLWIIDIGATYHMLNDPSQLISINVQTQSDILTANGGIAHVTCEGTTKASQSMNLDTVLFSLFHQVYYMLVRVQGS